MRTNSFRRTPCRRSDARTLARRCESRCRPGRSNAAVRSSRQRCWPALRSDEPFRANVGDVRPTDQRWRRRHPSARQGWKDRRIPVKALLVQLPRPWVARFTAAAKRRSTWRLTARPQPRRCSLEPTETESSAAQCNTGSCVPSAAAASTARGQRCARARAATHLEPEAPPARLLAEGMKSCPRAAHMLAGRVLRRDIPRY